MIASSGPRGPRARTGAASASRSAGSGGGSAGPRPRSGGNGTAAGRFLAPPHPTRPPRRGQPLSSGHLLRRLRERIEALLLRLTHAAALRTAGRRIAADRASRTSFRRALRGDESTEPLGRLRGGPRATSRGHGAVADLGPQLHIGARGARSGRLATSHCAPGLHEKGRPPAVSADVGVPQRALPEGGRCCGDGETALGQLKRSQSFA